MSDDVELNTKGLQALIKALKAKMPEARVGILGNGAARSGSKGSSNADIGAAHEFGTSRLPQRSFLRVPISDNLNRYLENSNAFDPAVLNDVVKQATFVPWLKKVAILAETIVADAFASGGFGKWKPSNMTRKKNKQTLVETQQLRNSITSEVKEA